MFNLHLISLFQAIMCLKLVFNGLFKAVKTGQK